MSSSCAEAIKGLIPFPCCPGEKVMAYESSRGKVSNKCPRCGKFALFDYDEMTATPAPAARGAAHKIRNHK